MSASGEIRNEFPLAVAESLRPHRSADRRLAAWLGSASLLCIVATAALYVLLIRTGTGQSAEESVIRGATSLLGDSRISFTGRLSAVSVLTVGLSTAGVVAAALLRRRPRLAAGLLVMVAGSLVSVQVLKHIVLSRPDIVPTNYAEGTNSFPSGHTSVGLVLAIAVVIVLPLRFRPWAWVLVGLFGATFGISTVLASFHRPSDVVGAHLVVAAWALGVTAVEVAWRGRTDSSDPPPTTVGAPLIVLLGGAAVALLAAIVWAFISTQIDRSDLDGRYQAMFIAAVAALTAEAAVGTAALMLVFRRLSLDPTSRGVSAVRQVPWTEINPGDAVEWVKGSQDAGAP